MTTSSIFFTILIVYIRGVPDDVNFGALAVPSRRQLLRALRTAATPLDAPALAAATGLHPNTVRFHLDVLIRTGFVRESSARLGRRGRPRTVYEPTTAGAHDTGYALLAAVLVDRLDATDGGGEAREAGRAWAQRLRPHPAGQPEDMQATAGTVAALFTELGFQPTLATNGGDMQMTLHACPFWSLAEDHPGIVCAVHLGLLQGLVEQGGQPGIEAHLTPFVRPRQCQADLVTTEA
ncbi:helix-turn-helix domain-containing protein [Actinoplanes sp. KI2]|uniref:helix-turn-helix transcriptional regulator n=1 Tax=Actinoplanes sp. KI2 TaxID=2983315 RepID=UPI0021D56B12|nr:helix-turn-helix domain-containing protein [Actinoplanes sp. KI2]MCU7730969.1 helix-turn-helix domain-containing protein [Actinoplanes sp. KI2]